MDCPPPFVDVPSGQGVQEEAPASEMYPGAAIGENGVKRLYHRTIVG